MSIFKIFKHDSKKESSKPTSASILKTTQDENKVEKPETTRTKVKWDENKLNETEKLKKNQVFMKIDEPNTPFIRYDRATGKVTNWEVVPENLRKVEDLDDFNLEDDDFKLDDSVVNTNNQFKPTEEPDEWKKIDEKEIKDKEELAKKRREEFEKKRAQYYYKEGIPTIHKKDSSDSEDEE